MNLETLPEEIRSHILSLMPTKSAAQTSILSKSWRYSWTSVTNLDFVFDFDFAVLPQCDLDRLTKFVNWVVFKAYKNPKLNLFRLNFGDTVKPLDELSNWIDEAVKLNVRELDIRVCCHHLPLSLFTCTTLTVLRLDYVHGTIWECPSRGVILPRLKTLDISVYGNPFVNAFNLIPGCPVLETLSLQVDYYKCEKRYVFAIPTLKKFKLTMMNKPRLFHKVVLRLPVLEYLCVGGPVSSVFVMEDLPAVVQASISSVSVLAYHFWLHLLKGISGSVQSLSILYGLDSVPVPIFPNVKHLELKMFLDQGALSQFLESCPELKHLCLGMKSSLSIWIEPKVVPSCITTKLTTLKYTLWKQTKRYDMKFLKYILGNAEALKTVTITCEQSLSLEEEMSLYTELLKFPRASMDCAIKRGNSRVSLLY